LKQLDEIRQPPQLLVQQISKPRSFRSPVWEASLCTSAPGDLSQPLHFELPHWTQWKVLFHLFKFNLVN
jgi:hypothetical protein